MGWGRTQVQTVTDVVTVIPGLPVEKGTGRELIRGHCGYGGKQGGPDPHRFREVGTIRDPQMYREHPTMENGAEPFVRGVILRRNFLRLIDSYGTQNPTPGLCMFKHID